MAIAPINLTNYQTISYKLPLTFKVACVVVAPSSGGSAGNTSGIGQIYPIR